MAKEKDYSEDSQNFYINEQNKKKKKELEEKYGMTSFSGNSEAPPEVMNNFLDYIQQFEENWEKAESKKIKEILGFPEFKKIEDIDPEFLNAEIDNVLKKYSEKNYFVDIIEKDDVKPEDYYKFLTEELMEHETDFMNIPGMNTNFIYEEFHPNDKLDAKDSIRNFYYGLKSKSEEHTETWLSRVELKLNGKLLTRADFLKEIFRLIPDNITEDEINITEIDISNKKVRAEFFFEHQVNIISSESVKKKFKAEFGIEKCEFGMFEIKSVNLA